ncbi:hypothetical protein JCM19238_2743 [Vibrio ponticus]|nr:hypothetical protein JCM19238_2743 [Vibrio ponticus]
MKRNLLEFPFNSRDLLVDVVDCNAVSYRENPKTGFSRA